jgi:hypothetical protein
MLKPTLLLIAAATFLAQPAQASGAERKIAQPRVKEVQVPFQSLKPSATFKIGKTADWVLVTDDAVWVGGSRPYSVQRIDPSSNKIVAKIRLSGEACSGLAFGFGSLWVPVCGKTPTLARVDATTNEISAVLPFGTAGAEGGIAASSDSVWIVLDRKGTLTRIDPRTNAVRQRISIPPGSYNPIFSDGMIWITGVDSNVLTVVDASTGHVTDITACGTEASVFDFGGQFDLDSEPRRWNGDSRRYEHKENNRNDSRRDTRYRRGHLLWCRFSLDSEIRDTTDSDRREDEHGLTPVGWSRWRCPAVWTRLNLAHGLSSWVALANSIQWKRT